MTRISSIQGLDVLNQGLIPESLDFAIVESAAEVLFNAVTPDALPQLLSFPRGVAFGNAGEFRWLKRRSGFHVVYISDAGKPLPGAQHSQELRPGSQPDGQLVLRGIKDASGHFLHGRLPNPLDYPFGDQLAAGTAIGIQIRFYAMEDGSEVVRAVAPAAVFAAPPGAIA